MGMYACMMQILGSFDIPSLHQEMACIEGLGRVTRRVSMALTSFENKFGHQNFDFEHLPY
jgi:hypothetical protein